MTPQILIGFAVLFWSHVEKLSHNRPDIVAIMTKMKEDGGEKMLERQLSKFKRNLSDPTTEFVNELRTNVVKLRAMKRTELNEAADELDALINDMERKIQEKK
jgi:hypothetical protein